MPVTSTKGSVKCIMADLQVKGIITCKGNNRSGEWIIK